MNSAPERFVWDRLLSSDVLGQRPHRVLNIDSNLFCGDKWCTGDCGYPKMIRSRPDGLLEAAAAMLGVSPVWCTSYINSEWSGALVEVKNDGTNPLWW